jgi:hypothetical protein
MLGGRLNGLSHETPDSAIVRFIQAALGGLCQFDNSQTCGLRMPPAPRHDAGSQNASEP